MNTGNNIYFDLSDHQYFFCADAFDENSRRSYDAIPLEKAVPEMLSDGSVAALMFVERDGKKGVMTLDRCRQGGYGTVVYKSNIFPLLYDEMLLNGSFAGYGVGYVAVRINNYWGVLRVEEIGLPDKMRSKSGRRCIMIIPCMYISKEAAIARIQGNQYHPEWGWRNPFEEQ